MVLRNSVYYFTKFSLVRQYNFTMILKMYNANTNNVNKTWFLLQTTVNTHVFKTALNLFGEISYNSGKIDIWSFSRSIQTTIHAFPKRNRIVFFIYVIKYLVSLRCIHSFQPKLVSSNQIDDKTEQSCLVFPLNLMKY
jgi:hypothetical protein